jgi:hypothetical protein
MHYLFTYLFVVYLTILYLRLCSVERQDDLMNHELERMWNNLKDGGKLGKPLGHPVSRPTFDPVTARIIYSSVHFLNPELERH